MKKTCKSILGLFLVSVFLFSCKKEKVAPLPADNTPQVTYSSIQDFYIKNMVPSQYFTINGSTGGTFTGTQGTIITIYPNTIVNSLNQPMTGNISFELKEIYKKSDMVLSHMPTMSYGQPLKSGGEFYLHATVNSQEVFLAPFAGYNAQMPAQSIDPAMGVFYWQSDSSSWAPASDSSSVSSVDSSYYFMSYLSNFNWVNCDHFYNTTNVTFNVDVLNETSTPNTQTFLLFQDKSVLELYYINQLFSSSYVPDTYPVTIITICINNGKIYAGFKNDTIAAKTSSISLSEMTLDQFKAQFLLLD